jgi:hypothetical protein
VLIHLPKDTKTLSSAFGLTLAFIAVRTLTSIAGTGCSASFPFLAIEALALTEALSADRLTASHVKFSDENYSPITKL